MFTNQRHSERSTRRPTAHSQRQRAANRRRRLAIRPRLAAELLESRILLTAGPVGDQFLVSEAIGLEGSPPAIVVHEDGSFTAAWESFQEDGSGQGIYSRHFNANGSPLGTTLRVNTQTLDDQTHPSIAADASGNVLIVWQSRHQDTDGDGIYGQWFSSMGETKLGAEFRINTTTAGDQRAPDVTIDGAGRAIVVWQSDGQDGEEWGVYYAVLDNFEDVVPSTETRVNDTTAGTQQAPTVAAAANGNFVIAWEALDPSGAEEASLEVYAKVYVAGATEDPTEFQVNTEMLRDQVSPQTAIDNDGDFVVVWQGEGIPGSGSDIFAQRFDETGASQGTEFRVNDTTLASQVGGRVAMDGEGNFLVTWQSVHQDGFSYGVFAREYGPAGNTLENEFVVNVADVEDPQVRPAVATFAGDGTTVVAWVGKSETHSPAVFAHVFDMPNTFPALRVGSEVKLADFAEFEENGPAAAMDIYGNTVVVWESYGEDGSGLGVYAQRLDAFGEPRNEEPAFLVNTHTLGNQSAPAVATSAEGPFVIVWQSEGQDAEGFGIYAQLYQADGSPLNGPILVNTTQLGNQMNPAVAMDEDGDFVVVWQADSLDPADTSSDIFAQRFTATGEKVQTEWQVNQFISLDQVSPAVAMNATGEFAIAWVSSHPAATGEEELDPEKSIFVQWYDNQGVANGGEVIAHNYVKDAQESPSVGIAASGDFVVAWQSINQDGSTWGVYGRQITKDKVVVGDEEFLVHEEHTEGLQRFAGVGVQADGHFVIAWQTNSPDVEDGSSLEVYRREYLPDGTPEAGENQVNTWTEGPQTLPVVARASTGDYGIFWAGQGFSHIDGVHGRLYGIHVSDDPGQPSRLPIGDQFPVAVTIGFESSSPAVAMNADGSFTLAFESFEDDGGGFGIVRQTFSTDQIPVAGTRDVVNTFVDGDQSHPAIASNENGRTLIVWQSTAQDSEGQGIYGQWYESDGTRVGLEFLVNTTVVGDQLAPSAAMDGEGRAVVAWQSFDGEDWDVYYKRYDVFGDTEAEELLAPTANEGDQQAPTVAAALTSGGFLIAWQGPGPVEEEGEASIEIFAQRFHVTGARDGAEFQVNVESLHDQVQPAAAMDADGGAVVVWQAEGQQGSGSDVFGRLLSSTTEFRANKTVSGPQRSPAVSMDGDGNFLVTWQSIHQDGYSWGIYGRSYDATGQILVDEALINERVEGPQTSVSADTNGSSQTLVIWLGNDSTHHPAVFGHRYLLPSDAAEVPSFEVGTELNLATYTGLEEVPPAAAMNADREAIVVWESYSEDGNGMGVFAQLLDAFGQPLEEHELPFQVNTFTAGNQGAPAVARSPDGRFVIVWESEDEDGDGYGIYAQRYSTAGDAAGDVFQVNTLEEGNQTTPAIAMDADGDFVVVWETDASTDGLLDIMARRFHADGTPVENEPEFRVNQRVELAQKDPAIAMNANGQFVIAWVSDHPAVSNPDDTEKSIFVQTFAPDGSFAGEERLVHRYVKDAQEAPALGIDAKGNFVVGWQSINQDGNSWGVFARQFLADETPVEGREFVVNETRMGPQRYVGVGMDEVGRFVITWQSNSHLQDGSAWDIYARQYGIGGWREGGELPVNTYNMGPQIRPVVAQAPAGDFGVFWLGQGPDHIEGVHGRLYASHFDYGDAAEPYPTVAALDGPRHLVGSGLFLGTSVDLEPDGLPTLDATGDDLLGDPDDEDGVQLAATLVARLEASIQVIASAAGKLDAWIDYNRDGVFSTAEQIALSHELAAGANSLSIFVPNIVVAGPSFARFRVSSAGGLAPTGLALDGEVEDYAVTIVDPAASSATVIDDPMRPGNSLLLVNGTGGADTITFAPDAINPQEIVVMRNGATMGKFANTAIGRIVAMGRLGPDVISVDKSIVLDTELHGNAGNDLIRGGGGNDVIYGGIGNDIIRGALGSDSILGGLGNDIMFGGTDDDWMDGEGGSDWITSGDGSDIAIGNDGNDQVFAGLGRDILVGGLGTDTLYGQTDDDIVVGGPTNLSIAAYKEARIAWNTAEAFPTRIANLATVLNSSSVLNDAASDAIYGGPDRDWLLDYELNDFFLDFSSDPVIGDKLN